MTEPISTVPAITTTPDVAAVAAEQTAIDGSGSEKYGASDWTAATGAGLDYPGGAIFDPTPSSPEAEPEAEPAPAPAQAQAPAAEVKAEPKHIKGQRVLVDPPARPEYN